MAGLLAISGQYHDNSLSAAWAARRRRASRPANLVSFAARTEICSALPASCRARAGGSEGDVCLLSAACRLSPKWHAVTWMTSDVPALLSSRHIDHVYRARNERLRKYAMRYYVSCDQLIVCRRIYSRMSCGRDPSSPIAVYVLVWRWQEIIAAPGLEISSM